MTRSFYARALGVATLVIAAAACGASSSPGSSTAASTAPATAAPSPSTAPASPSIAAASTSTAVAAPTTFDTRSLGTDFDLAMTLNLPADWRPLPPPEFGPAGSFGFVHVGTPADDYSQWWGPGLFLVGGASVLDPVSINDPSPADDAKRPWPSSYLDYLASIPGVTVVSGPESVTIGGSRESRSSSARRRCTRRST